MSSMESLTSDIANLTDPILQDITTSAVGTMIASTPVHIYEIFLSQWTNDIDMKYYSICTV